MNTTQASDPECLLSMPQALPWGESLVPRMVSIADQTLSSENSPPPCSVLERGGGGGMCCPVGAGRKASRVASECLSPATWDVAYGDNLQGMKPAQGTAKPRDRMISLGHQALLSLKA